MPDELRDRIAVALRVLKPFRRRAAGLIDGRSDEAAIDAVMGVLRGTVVLRPDLLGTHGGPGRFGVDEPWPPGVQPDAVEEPHPALPLLGAN